MFKEKLALITSKLKILSGLQKEDIQSRFSNSSVNRPLRYAAGVACILIVLFSFPHDITQIIAEEKPLPRVDHFKDVILEAKAAYVYDIRDGRALYSKNADIPLPLASITKVMTAITAADSAPGSTVVTVQDKNLEELGDSGLYANEQWQLKDILSFMLVVSSNDGAAAVASAFGTPSQNFVGAMNEKAKKLGLTRTYFLNESGLDVSETNAGAYGSAEDVAKLLEHALKYYPDIIASTKYPDIKVTSLNDIAHHAENTNIVAQKITGLLASKTGYSTLAGGNLVIVFDAGLQHQIAVVVLGSSFEGRFTDVEKLVETTIIALNDSV